MANIDNCPRCNQFKLSLQTGECWNCGYSFYDTSEHCSCCGSVLDLEKDCTDPDCENYPDNKLLDEIDEFEEDFL